MTNNRWRILVTLNPAGAVLDATLCHTEAVQWETDRLRSQYPEAGSIQHVPATVHWTAQVFEPAPVDDLIESGDW